MFLLIAQSVVLSFVALLFISALVSSLFGLFVSRHVPRISLIGLTLVTTIATLAAAFVFTRPLKTEAAVYGYAEIAAYLIIFLIFAAPVTIVGWLFRAKCEK